MKNVLSSPRVRLHLAIVLALLAALAITKIAHGQSGASSIQKQEKEGIDGTMTVEVVKNDPPTITVTYYPDSTPDEYCQLTMLGSTRYFQVGTVSQMSVGHFFRYRITPQGRTYIGRCSGEVFALVTLVR